MGSTLAQGIIQSNSELTADTDYAFHDELNGQSYHRPAHEVVNRGLHILLEGFHAHIFTVSRA